MIRAALAAVLGLVLLSGCAATPDQAGPASAPPPARPVPAAVEIPAIGARSTLIPLGLNEDGTIEVPPVTAPLQAGWYSYGPAPGEPGPAVVLGHVDGNGQRGIFFRLAELVPGERITVSHADGSRVHFVVTRVERVPKTEFPTEAVYGDTVGPELRLITCGGGFDRAARSYRDNIIVYAVGG